MSVLALETLVVRFVTDLTRFETGLARAEQSFINTTNRINMVAAAFGAGLAYVVGKASSDFDEIMTNTFSTMENGSAEARLAMENTALAMSAGRMTGPVELARGYEELARAGHNASQMMSEIGTFEQFSVVGKMSTTESVRSLLNLQRSLQFTSDDIAVNTMNLQHLGDVVALVANRSNTSARTLAEGLGHLGPTLRFTNTSLYEGAALLAAYAVQGRSAGEAAKEAENLIKNFQLLFARAEGGPGQERRENRQGLRVLHGPHVHPEHMINGPAPEVTHAWRALGIELYEVGNGPLRSITSLIGELNAALANMSPEERMATMVNKLGFQRQTVQAFIDIMGSGEDLARFTAEAKNADGMMNQIYHTMSMSFNSQFKILRNNVTVVAIQIGRILIPYLIMLNAIILKLFNTWNELPDAARTTIIAIGLTLVGVKALIYVLPIATRLLAIFLSPVTFTINMILQTAAILFGTILALTIDLGRAMLFLGIQVIGLGGWWGLLNFYIMQTLSHFTRLILGLLTFNIAVVRFSAVRMFGNFQVAVIIALSMILQLVAAIWNLAATRLMVNGLVSAFSAMVAVLAAVGEVLYIVATAVYSIVTLGVVIRAFAPILTQFRYMWFVTWLALRNIVIGMQTLTVVTYLMSFSFAQLRTNIIAYANSIAGALVEIGRRTYLFFGILYRSILLRGIFTSSTNSITNAIITMLQAIGSGLYYLITPIYYAISAVSWLLMAFLRLTLVRTILNTIVGAVVGISLIVTGGLFAGFSGAFNFIVGITPIVLSSLRDIGNLTYDVVAAFFKLGPVVRGLKPIIRQLSLTIELWTLMTLKGLQYVRDSIFSTVLAFGSFTSSKFTSLGSAIGVIGLAIYRSLISPFRILRYMLPGLMSLTNSFIAIWSNFGTAVALGSIISAVFFSPIRNLKLLIELLLIGAIRFAGFFGQGKMLSQALNNIIGGTIVVFASIIRLITLIDSALSKSVLKKSIGQYMSNTAFRMRSLWLDILGNLGLIGLGFKQLGQVVANIWLQMVSGLIAGWFAFIDFFSVLPILAALRTLWLSIATIGGAIKIFLLSQLGVFGHIGDLMTKFQNTMYKSILVKKLFAKFAADIRSTIGAAFLEIETVLIRTGIAMLGWFTPFIRFSSMNFGANFTRYLILAVAFAGNLLILLGGLALLSFSGLIYPLIAVAAVVAVIRIEFLRLAAIQFGKGLYDVLKGTLQILVGLIGPLRLLLSLRLTALVSGFRSLMAAFSANPWNAIKIGIDLIVMSATVLYIVFYNLRTLITTFNLAALLSGIITFSFFLLTISKTLIDLGAGNVLNGLQAMFLSIVGTVRLAILWTWTWVKTLALLSSKYIWAGTISLANRLYATLMSIRIPYTLIARSIAALTVIILHATGVMVAWLLAIAAYSVYRGITLAVYGLVAAFRLLTIARIANFFEGIGRAIVRVAQAFWALTYAIFTTEFSFAALGGLFAAFMSPTAIIVSLLAIIAIFGMMISDMIFGTNLIGSTISWMLSGVESEWTITWQSIMDFVAPIFWWIIGWFYNLRENIGLFLHWLESNWTNVLLAVSVYTVTIFEIAFTAVYNLAVEFGKSIWKALKGEGFQLDVASIVNNAMRELRMLNSTIGTASGLSAIPVNVGVPADVKAKIEEMMKKVLETMGIGGAKEQGGKVGDTFKEMSERRFILDTGIQSKPDIQQVNDPITQRILENIRLALLGQPQLPILAP